MIEISVVICTHNPRRDYFRRVLQALREQTLPSDRWELLIVDNASNEPLAPTWDISWHQHGRHVLESELGLAAARSRGIREARADVLVFVDDDNILDATYLEWALHISHRWFMLGVWGSGRTFPDFEVQPAASIKPFLGLLALRTIDKPLWTNSSFIDGAIWKDAMPWGAGLCARAPVARAYADFVKRSKIKITGPRGNLLLSNEDVEICLMSCQSGLGMGIFPELKIAHLLPERRLTKNYLLKLHNGQGVSDALLTYKWLGTIPRSPLSLVGILRLAKNLIVKKGIDRRMYLAYWRGAARAQYMILAGKW